MKKVITLIAIMVCVFTATFASANVAVYWNTDVTGLETSSMEEEFAKDGYDLAIVVSIDDPEDEVKFEKDLIRWTDDEYENYNQAYACLYDEFGLCVEGQEGTGSVSEHAAICRTHDSACVVNQLVSYLEDNYPGQNFEMYIYEKE